MVRTVAAVVAACCLASSADVPTSPRPTTQAALPRIEMMPDVPPGFALLDFAAVARGYDRIVFDPKRSPKPLMWWDDSKTNMPTTGVGLPSYVDHPEMKSGANHEAITVLGSILGGTLVGIDESDNRGANLAAMSAQYFNSANGNDVVLNRVSTPTGNSYWYELFPQVVFDAIAARYPDEKRLTEISDVSARRWLGAVEELSKDGTLDFEHTSFDLVKRKVVDNGTHREPDAAAGLAMVFLTANERAPDAKFLAAADACLATITSRKSSPSYEVLMPFGAYAAARLNAEHGRDHDVGLLLNHFFEPSSDVRPGWGVVVGNWAGREASGLIGSVTDAGGYGFTMNTYAAALGVVPVARYDERYARSIAKWMLNASGAVRYCYPGQLPVEHTSAPTFASDPPNVIAFEGIRRRYKGKSPYAGGDPTIHGWGPSDLGLYGSGFAGVYGAIVRPTSDPLILQLDLLAADPCPPKASYPTHLYFNPHDDERQIRVDVGATPVDLYDSLENRTIATAKSGKTELTIPSKAARMIVRVPAGSSIAIDGRQSKVGDVVIDYENGRQPPRVPPTRAVPPSLARKADVPRATVTIDGDPADWARIATKPIALTTKPRGTLAALASFAWDDEYLYVLVRQSTKAERSHEADTLERFAAAPWDFDAVNLNLDLANGTRPSISDFVLQMAFSSARATDHAFASQSPDDGTAAIRAATSGTLAAGDRVIEARVAWRGMTTATFGPSGTFTPKPGTTVGCEPLIVEENHKRQAYPGGGHYQKPTGVDGNSIDLVLR